MQNVARRVVRSALLFALALSIPSVPSLVQAAKKDKAARKGKARQGAQTKVVLAAFTGPKAETARGWAIKGMKNDDSIKLISDDKAASVAHGSSESDYASVAGGLGAAALVVGRVNLQKKVGWSLTLWVHNGADGKLIEKLTVRGGLLPGLRNKIEESIGEILAPALAKASGGDAPAEAEPAAEEPAEGTAAAEEVSLDEQPAEESALDEDEVDDEEEPVASGALGPSPLDLQLGLRFYQRSFNYSGTLHDYDPTIDPLLVHQTAAGSPMFIFSGNLYPIAFFSDGFLSHLGVMVGYEYGFLTKTSLPDPLEPGLVRELNQNHTEVYVGARYRLMLGGHEIVPYVAFGKHTFEIEDDKYPVRFPPPNETPYRDALPDVAYEYIDLGLAPRLVLGSFSVGASAAYRIVNDTGGLQQTSPLNPNGTEVDPYETWFPLAKGNGVSFGIQLGYALTELLEIQLGFDYTRYGFDFNHIPTAAERQAAGLPPIPPERIAGGATDTYVSGFLALGVRFPGSPVVGAAATPDSVVEDPENEDVEELDF